MADVLLTQLFGGSGTDLPVGTVLEFAGPPPGDQWVAANGQFVAITSAPLLHQQIGSIPAPIGTDVHRVIPTNGSVVTHVFPSNGCIVMQLAMLSNTYSRAVVANSTSSRAVSLVGVSGFGAADDLIALPVADGRIALYSSRYGRLHPNVNIGFESAPVANGAAFDLSAAGATGLFDAFKSGGYTASLITNLSSANLVVFATHSQLVFPVWDMEGGYRLTAIFPRTTANSTNGRFGFPFGSIGANTNNATTGCQLSIAQRRLFNGSYYDGFAATSNVQIAIPTGTYPILDYYGSSGQTTVIAWKNTRDDLYYAQYVNSTSGANSYFRAVGAGEGRFYLSYSNNVIQSVTEAQIQSLTATQGFSTVGTIVASAGANLVQRFVVSPGAPNTVLGISTSGNVANVHQTTNGGASWTIRTITGVSVRDAVFSRTTPTTVVVVGAAGAIRRSTDSGATWSTVKSGTSSDFATVACVGSTFAAGGTGWLSFRMSTDDGATWTAPTVSGLPVSTSSITSVSVAAVNNKLFAYAYASEHKEYYILELVGGTWTYRTTFASSDGSGASAVRTFPQDLAVSLNPTTDGGVSFDGVDAVWAIGTGFTGRSYYDRLMGGLALHHGWMSDTHRVYRQWSEVWGEEAAGDGDIRIAHGWAWSVPGFGRRFLGVDGAGRHIWSHGAFSDSSPTATFTPFDLPGNLIRGAPFSYVNGNTITTGLYGSADAGASWYATANAYGTSLWWGSSYLYTNSNGHFVGMGLFWSNTAPAGQLVGTASRPVLVRPLSSEAVEARQIDIDGYDRNTTMWIPRLVSAYYANSAIKWTVVVSPYIKAK